MHRLLHHQPATALPVVMALHYRSIDTVTGILAWTRRAVKRLDRSGANARSVVAVDQIGTHRSHTTARGRHGSGLRTEWVAAAFAGVLRAQGTESAWNVLMQRGGSCVPAVRGHAVAACTEILQKSGARVDALFRCRWTPLMRPQAPQWSATAN